MKVASPEILSEKLAQRCFIISTVSAVPSDGGPKKIRKNAV